MEGGEYLSCRSGRNASRDRVGSDEGVGADGTKSESGDRRLHGVVRFVDWNVN